jgi:glycosyltransferase involved in cell wall biosynthesis
MSSNASRKKPLDIALLGTRGIPANYGGFETFAEELSTRLVERGHQVTVYGRSHFVDSKLRSYRGVNIRVLPSVRTKYLETVTHTALSVLMALVRAYDIILICNAANAFVSWIPRLVGQKVILNVDGIERRRKKWNQLGKAYYRFSEFLSTLLPDRTVTDARSIQRYYLEEYGFHSLFIPYGAAADAVESCEALTSLGLQPRRYVLYVSRLEPENNAHLVIQAYQQSGVSCPLVVVGDAPYSPRYIQELHRLASEKNIVLPGAIYGQGYRELLSHCLCYIHATEVGGTHPALIEAMGAGCIVLVNETSENQEVVGEAGLLYPFNDLQSLGQFIRRICSRPEEYDPYRKRAQKRVREFYDWEEVVTEYEDLFHELTLESFV